MERERLDRVDLLEVFLQKFIMWQIFIHSFFRARIARERFEDSAIKLEEISGDILHENSVTNIKWMFWNLAWYTANQRAGYRYFLGIYFPFISPYSRPRTFIPSLIHFRC